MTHAPVRAPTHADAQPKSFEVSPELVAGIRAGDDGAFRELFRIAFGPLTRFALGYVDTYEAAEDVVQEVICRLWRQGESWVPRASARTYLFSAVRNTALNVRRRREVERRYEAQQEGPATVELETGSGDERDRVLAECQRAFLTLTERQRAAFQLRYERGLTVQETADVLGITPKATRKLLHRVIATLREKVKIAP